MEIKDGFSLPLFLPYRVVHFDTLPSTNAYLCALAREGEKEGLVAVANEQSEGKGRFSRRFYSPSGTGVYMSLLLRPTFESEHFPLLTALAGTAAAEAAEVLSGKRIGIKWVNDLYLNEKKIAGILAESGITQNVNQPLQNKRFVVLGIGINLAMPACVPEELSGKMGALFSQEEFSQVPAARERFVSLFLSHFHAYYEKMPERAFLNGYRKRSILKGRRVLLYSAATCPEKEGEGECVTVLDVDENGALLIKDENGRVRSVNAGEVTLSF